MDTSALALLGIGLYLVMQNQEPAAAPPPAAGGSAGSSATAGASGGPPPKRTDRDRVQQAGRGAVAIVGGIFEVAESLV